MEIKVQAEPLPLDTFDEEDDMDDAQNIYRAVSILFSLTHCGEHDVYRALEMLEAAEYRVDLIDGSFRKTLLDARTESTSSAFRPKAVSCLTLKLILSARDEIHALDNDMGCRL